MSRAGVSVTSDAIRIEDEVWDEAFATRVPSSRNSGPRPVTVVDNPTAIAETPRGPARPASSPPSPARRTVTIKGRGAERNLPWPGEPTRARAQPRTATRRSARPVYERSGFKPDRLAMWAMFLGFLLALIAVLSH